jgi:hypothetical protein
LCVYGCETWSLTLKNYIDSAFDNRVLRRISGPKRKEGTGGWRKLQSGELHNLYSSQNNIRLITGHTACIGQKRKAYKISVIKSKGIGLLGRPRCGREDDIKMYLKETVSDDIDNSSGSGHGSAMGSCEHNNELSGSIKN